MGHLKPVSNPQLPDVLIPPKDHDFNSAECDKL